MGPMTKKTLFFRLPRENGNGQTLFFQKKNSGFRSGKVLQGRTTTDELHLYTDYLNSSPHTSPML